MVSYSAFYSWVGVSGPQVQMFTMRPAVLTEVFRDFLKSTEHKQISRQYQIQNFVHNHNLTSNPCSWWPEASKSGFVLENYDEESLPTVWVKVHLGYVCFLLVFFHFHFLLIILSLMLFSLSY